MAKAVMSFVVRHDAIFALAASLATVHICGESGCRENAGQQKGDGEAFHLSLHSHFLSCERKDYGKQDPSPTF